LRWSVFLVGVGGAGGFGASLAHKPSRMRSRAKGQRCHHLVQRPLLPENVFAGWEWPKGSPKRLRMLPLRIPRTKRQLKEYGFLKRARRLCHKRDE